MSYEKVNNEYILDRKQKEITELQIKIIKMEEDQAIRESQIILAEVILFLLGMAVGAVAMHSFGR